MGAEWTKSPVAPRVLALTEDPRPAWLWAQDGETLLWSNPAAQIFAEHGLPSGGGDQAVPVRGQISRLLRLGALGISSRSQIQFSIGRHPRSATCTYATMTLPDKQPVLLLIGLDPLPQAQPVETEQASTASEEAEGEDKPGSEAEVAVPGTSLTAEPQAAALQTEAKAHNEEAAAELQPEPVVQAEMSADTVIEEASAQPAAAEDSPPVLLAEPQIERDQPPVEAAEAPVAAVLDPTSSQQRRLSELFDRLANDEQLFSPLGPADEQPPVPLQAVEPSPKAVLTDQAPAPETLPLGETPPPLPPEMSAVQSPPPLEQPPGIAPETAVQSAEALAPPPVPVAVTSPEPVVVQVEAGAIPSRDAETVERASRYNFDELSRILTDRVGGGEAGQPPLTIEGIVRDAELELAETGLATVSAGSRASANLPANPSGSSLVNLSGETLVLNRLPLGILVFRDQQVLFANRSITEMVGYGSVDELRRAGLAAIFPGSGDGTQGAGPINHLVQKDGTLIPVTARLQSTSWQGKPALMLSASATEVRTSHEGAVRAFAEMLAETRGDGFIETTRSGVISHASTRAAAILQRSVQQLTGRPLTQLVASEEMAPLKEFLEKPARFAETARPCLGLRGSDPGTDLMLFAQGQSGVITGYFGLVRQLERTALTGPAELDPALLSRISRGVRRPLNTIIGFSDMIRSAAFGPMDNARYREYAADIKKAGHEIAALVDELDDYTRLKDGRYIPNPADVDLGGLLESCVVRVRAQANAARVLVRSAISERLPRITADRASFGQAVLNLLASAIDQTPPGGSVVLSAHQEDDQTVTIHVRDSARGNQDPTDRFVVFRDGVGREGETLGPVRSSVGLALTRSLLAVNGSTLLVDATGSTGTLFAISIPNSFLSTPRIAPAGRAD